MTELFFSCPAALEEVLVDVCAGAGVSRADKDTLMNWKTPGDADEATLSALKRALDAQSGAAPHNLRSFLRLHAFTPVLRSRRRACSVALESKEARRDELRARQQHRDYNGLVADLRKSEIEQVGLWEGQAATLTPLTSNCAMTLQRQTDSFSTYKQQLAIGSSVFLSLISAVALGYYLARRLGYSDATVWTCALGSGIVLLLVEVALVMLKLSHADEAAKRRRKQQDRQG